MKEMEPCYAVDLDSTLALYTEWKGAGVIGSPIRRMVRRVKDWLAAGKKVVIFTARVAGDTDGVERRAIQKFCRENFGQELPITNRKDQSMVRIYDDRAVQVEANTGRLLKSAVADRVVRLVRPSEGDGLAGQWGVVDSDAYTGRIKQVEESVSAAARECQKAREPTEAQKKAGNYKAGHCSIDGLNITVENQAGSTRSGTAPDGTKWSTRMHAHYGYVKGSDGFDGDQVDVFINPDRPISGQVFVVHQVDPDSQEFDEHKAMIGYLTPEEAKEAYLENYDKGWKGLGKIERMKWVDFKKWVFSAAPRNSTLRKSKWGRMAKVAARAVAADPGMRKQAAMLLAITSVDENGRLNVDSDKVRGYLDLSRMVKAAFDSTSCSKSLRKSHRGGKSWLYGFCAKYPDSPLCSGIRRRSSKGTTDES